jgi:hypothetical protein
MWKKNNFQASSKAKEWQYINKRHFYALVVIFKILVWLFKQRKIRHICIMIHVCKLIPEHIKPTTINYIITNFNDYTLSSYQRYFHLFGFFSIFIFLIHLTMCSLFTVLLICPQNLSWRKKKANWRKEINFVLIRLNWKLHGHPHSIFQCPAEIKEKTSLIKI